MSRRHGFIGFLAIVLAVATSACAPSQPSAPSIRIVSVAVKGRDLFFGFGVDQANFTVTAMLSTGASVDVTTSAVWRSSDEAVAYVSATEPGKVIERAIGTTTISATYQGLTDSRATSVRCGIFLGVGGAGPSQKLTMKPGESVTLTTSLNQYVPMERRALADWSSSNPDVVAFGRTPLTPYYGIEARALRPGTSTLTARIDCAVEVVLAIVAQ